MLQIGNHNYSFEIKKKTIIEKSVGYETILPV